MKIDIPDDLNYPDFLKLYLENLEDLNQKHHPWDFGDNLDALDQLDALYPKFVKRLPTVKKYIEIVKDEN